MKKSIFALGVQIIILLIIGIWAISGSETEVYRFSYPATETNFALARGTYRAYITYTSDDANNAGTFISLSANPSFLADTLQFYPWETVDYLQLWAYRDIPDVSFVYNHSGGELEVQDVTIFKTKDSKRMLWVCLAFFFFMGNIFAIWLKKLLKNPEERKSHILTTIIFLGVLILLCFPLRLSKLIDGNDITFHLSRIEGLKETLLTGQIPSRIQTSWLEGAGYAVSIMYGDILLYFPAILRIMGFSLQFSLKCYIAFINAGTLLLTYYAFKKISHMPVLSMIGASVYTLSFYHTANIYIRQALGEYTSMMFFPLLFVGFYIILTEDSDSPEYHRNWKMPAIGMTGILTSHCISSIMVTIFLFLWILLKIKTVLKKNVFQVMIKTVLGTVFLSAFFLIPFVDYLFTMPMNINSGLSSGIPAEIQYAGVTPRQMFALWYTDEREMHILGGIYVFVALLLLVLTLSFRNKYHKWSKQAVIPSVLLLVSTALGSTLFPWDFLCKHSSFLSTIAQTLQFPFRFSAMSVFLGAFCFILLFSADSPLLSSNKRYAFALLILLLTVPQIFFIFSCERTPYQYKIYDGAGLGLFIGYGTYSTFILYSGEYLPQNVSPLEYRWQKLTPDDGLEIHNYNKTGARITFACSNSASENRNVSLPLLYYKGYQGSTSSSDSISVFSGANGSVTASIPANYMGDVTIDFYEPWYWRVAEVLSLLAVCFLFHSSFFTEFFPKKVATVKFLQSEASS